MVKVNQMVKVFAGCLYEGKVVEVTNEGFWLTENYETEEFVSFADLEWVK
jgi:hypothetical protein